jgi:RHS repeat-associated protein
MKDHKDKGILQIDYNFLNLPNYLKFDQLYFTRGTWQNTNTVNYYKADGTKIKKEHRYSENNVYRKKITEYLDGFQYEIIANGGDPTIKFVPTSEGYFDFEKNKYIYNYADHLGNVRLSYFHNGSSIEVLEENNYYPFGLKHEGYNALAGNKSYQYKYNGKELQETGMYDYGARFYMPDIGRWGVIDPRSQYTHEAYSYVWNNPISFNDPTGMEGEWAFPNRDGRQDGEIWKDSDGMFYWDKKNGLWKDFNNGSSVITEVTVGQSKKSNSGPASLAMSALYVSQADSPAPGPADAVAFLMLVGAGIWWANNQLSPPSSGNTIIIAPGIGDRNLKTEDTAGEDTDVNGVKVPQEGKDFDDVWNDAKDGDETKGKSTQKEKDISDWEEDSKINLQNEKEINTKFGKGRTGLDSNGNRVNIRPGSKGANGGNPTIERIKNGRYQKIRYK